jgi:protein-S-isoprenylcysteine O-methyltransferase Ste14
VSPYYTDHSLTVVLFSVTIAVWVLLELQQSLRRRAHTNRRDRGSYYVLVLCLAAAWAATALSLKLPHDAVSQPAGFIVGLLLTWTGLVLRGWAFFTLGSYFTFHVQTSSDQPVISTGPYRLVRHPGYTGLLLILIGMSLMYGAWTGLAAMMVLPTIGLIYRIRVEEQALNRDLGAPYGDYAAHRKRLVPYLW